MIITQLKLQPLAKFGHYLIEQEPCNFAAGDARLFAKADDDRTPKRKKYIICLSVPLPARLITFLANLFRQVVILIKNQ